MVMSVRHEVVLFKREVDQLIQEIRCGGCGKLLAGQLANGDVAIKCNRCKETTVIHTH